MASSLNIHLIGKQGSGKSSTGNYILKGKHFSAKSSSTGHTLKIQHAECDIDARPVRVWDGPGVTEDQTLTVDIVKNIKQEMEGRRSEKHILVWIYRYGELCGPDDEYLLEILLQAFGKDFMEANAVLLVTHIDNFYCDVAGLKETFDQWVRQQTGVFRDLCGTCKERIFPVDNRSKTGELRDQLNKRLLSVSKNCKRFDPTRKFDLGNQSKETATAVEYPVSQPPGDEHLSDARLPRQKRLREDSIAFLKRQIRRLETIHFAMEHEEKLASLEEIRNELKTADPNDRSDLLLVVGREVDRAIEQVSSNQQTKCYLSELAKRL